MSKKEKEEREDEDNEEGNMDKIKKNMGNEKENM